MTTLAVAYTLAWSAVSAYVGWIGLQQRRLSRRIDAVDSAAHADVRERTTRQAA